jgi:hypothetical protein
VRRGTASAQEIKGAVHGKPEAYRQVAAAKPHLRFNVSIAVTNSLNITALHSSRGFCLLPFASAPSVTVGLLTRL